MNVFLYRLIFLQIRKATQRVNGCSQSTAKLEIEKVPTNKKYFDDDKKLVN